MSNIRVQNVNGAKPQHIRDDNSASIIANNIASRVSVSNRETVTALAQIQQSGFAGLMSNIDSKNIKLVDLILGRVASLLDEEFAQLNQQDLAKLKADLVSQVANISATQMTKADKAELQASLTTYFDKKINMKQLELQLADLNVTVHGLQKQLNTVSGTTTVSSPSTSYAGTINAVNSAMKSFSAQFAMVPMQLDAVLKNQQLILNSVSGMYSSINKIYAIVDAIDTKQTWEMLKPFVEPLYKKMYNYLFGLFGAKPPFEQSDEDDKTIIAQIGDRIDFAAKQVVYAINTQFEFLANKKFYKYVPYSTVNLREPTQLESTWALIKSWFSSKNYKDVLEEIMFDPTSTYLQIHKKEEKEREKLNKLLEKHFDGASGPEAFFSNTTEQIAAKKKEQAVAEAAKRTQSFQERVESWLHGVDKILGVFKKDVVDDGKKERSVWDTIKNFFKGIANIVDWAANGADSPTAPNMWKHFGLSGLPEIVDKVNKILNGEFKFEGNNFLSGLGSILNGENFKLMLDLLKDKQSLSMMQNIAASAASVFNSDAMKLFASVYAANQDKNGTKENESWLDKATVWLKIKFFDKLVILRDKLKPLFGSETGQYDVTKALISNFIDLGKKLPELFGVVQSVDDLWNKITETSIYKKFNESTEESKNTAKEFNLDKITVWVDKISNVVGKLSSTGVVDKVKTLISKLEEIEFSKLESLLKSTDSLFNILKDTNLMSMFSSSENASEDGKPKPTIEEKTNEIISYILAADKILKTVNESSLVASLNTLVKSFGEDDVASNIAKAVSPINTVFELYKNLKAIFKSEYSTQQKFDSNKIVEHVKDAAKILDAVVKENIIDKIVNVAKSVESANIAGVLGSTDDPDSLFGKLNNMIVGAANLNNVIKEKFGASEGGNASKYSLDDFSKDLNHAMLIIQKIDGIVSFIGENNTIDKAAEQIGKLNNVFKTISSTISTFGGLFGKSSGNSGEPLSKTLDSATTTIVAFDNLLSTVDSFDWNKLMTNLAKIVNTAIIAPINNVFKTINKVSDKIVSIINKLVDTFQNLLIKLAKIQNKTIILINKLPGVDIKWRAEENLDFSDYKIENKIQLAEIPEVRIEAPQELSQSSSEQIDTDTIKEMSRQGAADSKLVVDTINMLRKEISKLSESNTGSFSDVNGNLAKIDSALQMLVVAQTNRPSPAFNTNTAS